MVEQIKMGLYFNPTFRTYLAFSQSPAPVPAGYYFVHVIAVDVEHD